MDKETLKQSMRKYAELQGFLLQPDEKLLDSILTGLLKREEKFGFRYCPCRMVTGDKEKDKNIICPCIYHKDEVKNDGFCKCRLFLRKKSS